MDLKKLYLTPLALFTTSLLFIIAIDFVVRSLTGTQNTLGLPEILWFSLHVLVGIFATTLFWKNAGQKSISIKLIYFIPLLLAFFIFYSLIIYGYVIGTAIDGF